MFQQIFVKLPSTKFYENTFSDSPSSYMRTDMTKLTYNSVANSHKNELQF